MLNNSFNNLSNIHSKSQVMIHGITDHNDLRYSVDHNIKKYNGVLGREGEGEEGGEGGVDMEVVIPPQDRQNTKKTTQEDIQ